MKHLPAALLVVLLMASGCRRNVNSSGAEELLPISFDTFDDKRLQTLIGSAYSPPGTPPASVDSAIVGFSQTLGDSPTASLQNRMRDARNAIQGTLLAASNNRCNGFKIVLRERASNVGFSLGSLSTITGTAGAIVTAGSSRILSGIAGSFAGVNAQYQRDILSSLATSVIIPGIDQERGAILQEIADRRCAGVQSYDLTTAIVDALRYNSACSTDRGVAAAGVAISQARTQSLDDVLAALKAFSALQDAIRPNQTDAKGPDKPAAAPAVGARRAAPKTEAAPGDPSSRTQPEGTPPSNPTPAAATPLVGEALNIRQCPSLNANGLLPVLSKEEVRGPSGAAASLVVPRSPRSLSKNAQTPLGME